MATLEKEINKDAEEEFFLETKDFLRPSLKQINNSVFEIKKYFTSDVNLRVVPSEIMSPLKEIKDDLIRCLTESTILSTHDLVTEDELSTCFKRGFVFLAETLALALDFPIPDRPEHVKCDAFIVLPHQPVMVLTLTKENRESQETRMYNTCVARGVTTALRRFMNDSVNVIFGVMLLSDLKETVGFQDKLKTLAECSSLTVTEKSLLMNPQKYDNILVAFWAGVSEIKFSQGANEKDFISFLSKEQCILMVENINRKVVSVSCKPGTGATTLMQELAKRLSNSDDTLMVCWCAEDMDKILCWRWSKGEGHRSVCNYADLELGSVDLSKFTNVLDETGVVKVPMRGRIWRFTKDSTTVEELQQEVELFEKIPHNMQNLIYLLSSEDRKSKMIHLSGELDTLKLLDIRFQGFASTYGLHRNLEFEFIPVKQTPTAKRSSEGTHETEQRMRHMLDDLKTGLQKRKDLYPILSNEIKRNRYEISYLQAKTSFLESERDSEKIAGLKKMLKTMKMMESQIEEMEGLTDEKDSETITELKKMSKRIKKVESQIEVMEGHTDVASEIPRSVVRETEADRDLDQDRPKQISYKSDVHPTNVIHSTSVQLPDMEAKNNPLVKETDSEKIAGLKKRLKTLKMEVEHRKEELKGLTDGTDHRIEWEYNMDHLSQQMAAIEIRDVVADIIGEDQIPVSTEQLMKPDALLGEDQNTWRRGVKPCLIYKLRNLQQGKLKQRDLVDMLRDVLTYDQRRLTNLKTKIDGLEHAYGMPVYIAGEIDTDRSGLVSCPPMTFNNEQVGDEDLTVWEDGQELVNWRGRSKKSRPDRFKNYYGTSSRLHIPPSSSKLTAVTYWETNTRLQVKKEVSEFGLLEMALVGEGEVDRNVWVSFQSQSSWSLRVGHCDKHPGHICTMVWENGEQVGECQTDTMSPTPGTDVTLKYGITLDVGRGRLAFIDVNRGRVLHKCHINFSRSFSRMFCVWPWHQSVLATMRLISGSEVAMTGEKHQLINQALFSE